MELGSNGTLVPSRANRYPARIKAHWVDHGEGVKELQAFRRVAPGHKSFLDIGAAQGIFSTAFCTLTDGDAYAIEPSNVMFPSLNDLIECNPTLRITPFHLGIGSSVGTVEVRQHRPMVIADSSGDGMTMEVDTSMASLSRAR